MNDDLKRLCGRIEALKEASMFGAREAGEAALDSLKRVLLDFDRRLSELENFKKLLELENEE